MSNQKWFALSIIDNFRFLNWKIVVLDNFYLFSKRENPQICRCSSVLPYQQFKSRPITSYSEGFGDDLFVIFSNYSRCRYVFSFRVQGAYGFAFILDIRLHDILKHMRTKRPQRIGFSFFLWLTHTLIFSLCVSFFLLFSVRSNL